MSAMSLSGESGPAGPVHRPSLRTAFRTLCAKDAIYPSQSNFQIPLRRDLAHPSRSKDAKIPSAIVWRLTLSRRYSLVWFLSLDNNKPPA